MDLRTALLAAALPAILAFAGSSLALQDKQAPSVGMPKPTKEHEWLKGLVGTWDCNIMVMGASTKATETTKTFGDFWIQSDFEGSFMDIPFKGLRLMTYDPMKKKYITSWCESTTPYLSIMEGTTDAAGKTLTSTGTGLNMQGALVEYTKVLEIKGPDELTLTMYETAKGASAPTAVTIEYKRHK